MSKYRTIVADPPWLIGARIGKGGRRSNETVVPYSFMSVEAIAGLPVVELAHEDCVLFLWATRAIFRRGEAVRVAEAWGFEDCGEIIWGLRNPGIGSRTLANDHEPCLIARRGNPRLESDSPLGVWFFRQVYEYGPAGVPQKVHSAKPPGFLEHVERIADGPRLELFAREQRLGWDTWGDQALGHVEMAS